VEGLSTPAAGPNTYIGLTSSMRSVTTLNEHVGLQADQEQVLCRELVCVCDELQSCCEHAASAVTVHPRVQTLLLTRPSALLQPGTSSEWMCGEMIEQQMQQERCAFGAPLCEWNFRRGAWEKRWLSCQSEMSYCSRARKLRVWWVEAGSASAHLQHTNAARVFAGVPQSGFASALPAMRCSIPSIAS